MRGIRRWSGFHGAKQNTQNSTLFWVLVVVMRQQASVPGMTYADTILQNHYANMLNGVLHTKLTKI